MEPSFWHERWKAQQIGFHQAEFNPLMVQNWPLLGLPTGRVFVPLCGKSRDLLWLRQQGYEAVGIELSPLAVAAFFEENGMQPTHHQAAGLAVWQADGITLFCGDFFALTQALLGHIDAVYDRAALVALPQDLRTRYASAMAEICPGLPHLIITMEYQQSEMQGPPFSVTTVEVNRLFSKTHSIKEVVRADALSPPMRARGLSQMTEVVYILQPCS